MTGVPQAMASKGGVIHPLQKEGNRISFHYVHLISDLQQQKDSLGTYVKTAFYGRATATTRVCQ